MDELRALRVLDLLLGGPFQLLIGVAQHVTDQSTDRPNIVGKMINDKIVQYRQIMGNRTRDQHQVDRSTPRR